MSAIKEGDFVRVARGRSCGCLSGWKIIGTEFVVPSIHLVLTLNFDCCGNKVHAATCAAFGDGAYIETWRLEKIDPPALENIDESLLEVAA